MTDRPGTLARTRLLLTAAGDLLLGAVCPGCGCPGLGLCGSCRVLVDGAGARLTRPDPRPAGFPLTATCAAYEDPFRSMIITHKEDGALLLAPVLGRLLARSIQELIIVAGAQQQPIAVVPMPSAGAAVRRRGYDAVTTMTRHAVRVLRRSGHDVVVVRLLRQRWSVRDQAGLDAIQRRANLAGGLRVVAAAGIRTRWLVLADDVVTTGSTLTEAARVLRDHGGRVLGGATVAATRRRGSATMTVIP